MSVISSTALTSRAVEASHAEGLKGVGDEDWEADEPWPVGVEQVKTENDVRDALVVDLGDARLGRLDSGHDDVGRDPEAAVAERVRGAEHHQHHVQNRKLGA